MEQISKYKSAELIRTIDEDEDVDNFSENSDEEIEFQPSQQKNKQKVDFDTDFQFVSSIEEYNKNPWNDLTKYIKRKAKTKTDDKIKKILQSRDDHSDEESNGSNDDHEDTMALSEDELKHDKIKIKASKKRKRTPEDDQFFEDGNTEVESSSFYQMNLSRPLLKAIGHMKFIHPTPIQASTIPVALLGRDICGCAATGTGKTAAYMLPTLERLLYRPIENTITRVLVLVPTRELGVQVYQVTKQLAQYTSIQVGLAVGGLDLKAQEAVLRKNPDIVIATPGRLIDHLKSTPTFGLEQIEVLILDEADRMLDEYFAEQMKEIIKQCARTRQTMLFSATMTDEVESLAAVSLVKPVRLFVDSNREVAFNLRQEFVRIRSDHESDREPILAALVCRTFRDNCMIFVQTKKQAHRLHIMLGLLGIKVGELHGNLTQPQRLDALQRFKDKTIDCLVATDVAARGLDIQGVQTVINFVMPATVEHYIHRVGRTARAGRAGVSVSLAGEQERKMVKEVVKRANNPVKSRVIPPDVLEKYRVKLGEVEVKITEIIQEEYEERLLSKTENQANRAEKLLKGEKKEVRPWFQTKRERKEEKDKLSITEPKPTKQNKQPHKKTKSELPKKEVDKVALIQAKLAKRRQKMKKISAVDDGDSFKRGGDKSKPKKKKTHFGNDLWDTSTKNSKKLRHEANFAKKINNKNKNKSRVHNKSNKKGPGGGKMFGRPQQKKHH